MLPVHVESGAYKSFARCRQQTESEIIRTAMWSGSQTDRKMQARIMIPKENRLNRLVRLGYVRTGSYKKSPI